MGLLTKLVSFPILGPASLVEYVARTVAEEADRELLDEESVRGDLLALQERLEAGEISEADHERSEDLLMQRLSWIREIKEQRGGRT